MIQTNSELIVMLICTVQYRIVGYFPELQIFPTEGHPALSENFPIQKFPTH